MAVPDGRSTASAAEELSHNSKVAWAEPVQFVRRARVRAPRTTTRYTPPSPRRTPWDLADLHRQATGRGIKVAVIDSGSRPIIPTLPGSWSSTATSSPDRPNSRGPWHRGRRVIAAKATWRWHRRCRARARPPGLRACWQQRHRPRSATGSASPRRFYFAVREGRCDQPQPRGPDSRLLRTLLEAALRAARSSSRRIDSAKPGGGFPASVPGVIAVSDRSFAGDDARRLHCAGTRRANHGARGTMVSRQWQLLFGRARERPCRASSSTAPRRAG